MGLSLLPPALGEALLEKIFRADLALALNAAKYLESGRDEIVSRLLKEVRAQRKTLTEDHEISWAIEFRLPVTEVHEPDLRALIECGGSLGAAAVNCLVELKGAQLKEELLQILKEHSDDYNLCCNGVGRALRPFATSEDAIIIARWADSMQNRATPEPDGDKYGFVSGAATFLSGIDLSIIRRIFFPSDSSMELSSIRAEIVCDILRDHHSTTALDLAAELLLRGVNEAATAIYFISRFAGADDKLSWDSFTVSHINRLVSILNDDDSWALRALLHICSARPDLAQLIKQIASKENCVKKALLLNCISASDPDPVFRALSELATLGDDERRKEPIQALDQIELDWSGREKLLVQLLMLRDAQLAFALFGGSIPPSLRNLKILEIGQIEWWLQWMTEMAASDTDHWIVEQFGGLFGEHLDRNTQEKFVAEFNKPKSNFRRLLAKFVLPYFNELTTDAFSEDATSFLLADLDQEGSASSFRGHLLGRTATERFVAERLMPLLEGASTPFSEDLQRVLKQAGSRHGRRYLLP